MAVCLTFLLLSSIKIHFPVRSKQKYPCHGPGPLTSLGSVKVSVLILLYLLRGDLKAHANFCAGLFLYLQIMVKQSALLIAFGIFSHIFCRKVYFSQNIFAKTPATGQELRLSKAKPRLLSCVGVCGTSLFAVYETERVVG